jgi:hypothetical protein
MSECYCDYDPAVFYHKTRPKARRAYTCEECLRTIEPGQAYENVFAKWEDWPVTFKTCAECADLRQWVKNNVPCLCWAHGNLFEDLQMAVNDACCRAPLETAGLRFGFLRRMNAIWGFTKRRAKARAMVGVDGA